MRTAVAIRKKRFRTAVLSAALFCGGTFAELTGTPAVFDFGTMPRTDIGTECSFTLTNNGKGAVEILAITPSCDCLIPDLQSGRILPGRRTELPLFFDFGEESGKQQRSVQIKYRETATGKDQQLTLYVTGTISTPVMCDPEQLVFGALQIGSEASQSVTLFSPQDTPFSLKESVPSESWTLDFTAGKPAVRHEIGITIKTDQPGPFSLKLPVLTDHPEMPLVLIDCSGIIRSPFEIQPALLRIGQEPLNETILIKSVFNENFSIKSAEATDPALLVSAEKNGHTAQINVFKKENATCLANSLIRIVTDHPVSPVIEIPVRALSPGTPQGTQP